MVMRATRAMVVLTAVMFAVFAAAYVSAQGPDVKSLAGKWSGYASPSRGSNVPLEVNLKPDGSYTSSWGGKSGTGRIMMEGGKLMAQGHLLYGPARRPEGHPRGREWLSRIDGELGHDPARSQAARAAGSQARDW